MTFKGLEIPNSKSLPLINIIHVFLLVSIAFMIREGTTVNPFS